MQFKWLAPKKWYWLLTLSVGQWAFVRQSVQPQSNIDEGGASAKQLIKNSCVFGVCCCCSWLNKAPVCRHGGVFQPLIYLAKRVRPHFLLTSVSEGVRKACRRRRCLRFNVCCAHKHQQTRNFEAAPPQAVSRINRRALCSGINETINKHRASYSPSQLFCRPFCEAVPK